MQHTQLEQSSTTVAGSNFAYQFFHGKDRVFELSEGATNLLEIVAVASARGWQIQFHSRLHCSLVLNRAVRPVMSLYAIQTLDRINLVSQGLPSSKRVCGHTDSSLGMDAIHHFDKIQIIVSAPAIP